MISFEDFKKINLKTAKIITAERVEGSEKLIKLEIDLGQEKRQLMAGIGHYYNPEDIKGRDIIVVANLEPRIIFGVESQGMLLAANLEGRPVLIGPDDNVPPGTEIR